jgi:hypothetical protein
VFHSRVIPTCQILKAITKSERNLSTWLAGGPLRWKANPLIETADVAFVENPIWRQKHLRAGAFYRTYFAWFPSL